MEELGGEGREKGGGVGVGAPFNVLHPGATDLVAPLVHHRLPPSTTLNFYVVNGFMHNIGRRSLVHS